MNKLIAFFVILLIPVVFAGENVPIKTEINVKIDNGMIKITGENFEWSKLLNITNNSVMDINEDIEIILIREFGNMTELSRLMDSCAENLNFTQKWKECIELNSELDIRIRQMINGTAYEECMKNNTELKYQWNLDKVNLQGNCKNEKDKLQKEIDNIQTHKSILMIIAFVLAITTFFLLKKTGWSIGRSSIRERDQVMDVPA